MDQGSDIEIVPQDIDSDDDDGEWDVDDEDLDKVKQQKIKRVFRILNCLAIVC